MKITGVTVKTPEQLDVVMQVNQITLRFYKSFYFFITSPSYIMVKFRSSCFHCRRLCRTHFTLAETDLRGQWFFIWQHGHRIKKKKLKKMESWHNCLGIFLCHRVEKNWTAGKVYSFSRLRLTADLNSWKHDIAETRPETMPHHNTTVQNILGIMGNHFVKCPHVTLLLASVTVCGKWFGLVL